MAEKRYGVVKFPNAVLSSCHGARASKLGIPCLLPGQGLVTALVCRNIFCQMLLLMGRSAFPHTFLAAGPLDFVVTSGGAGILSNMFSAVTRWGLIMNQHDLLQPQHIRGRSSRSPNSFNTKHTRLVAQESWESKNICARTKLKCCQPSRCPV
ncbi:hypothetical protein P152DRAFT_337756 [Eremomyces bilateralis CBS 781.70]|uniref:Uncharacterized protein n=1 Tax=Eremomyces bilateralis CBS 781.70 TaxID=1392243 RepID=A0A6G1G4Q9_9PEZI|nr:uncharacterized protein P152DRAFT_337756 [Eremomyces bilateralis CBS 781.70]KAF1813075.1 hypothetical protein P152DRAFT_337756 [Eremomyces bilateralis CBS 781.70]